MLECAIADRETRRNRLREIDPLIYRTTTSAWLEDVVSTFCNHIIECRA